MGWRATRPALGQMPVAVRREEETRDASIRCSSEPVGRCCRAAAEPFRPFQREDVILHTEHRGRVDRLALEDAFDQLAALGHPEDLGEWPGRRIAFETLDRARAEDEDAVTAFAAKRLLPGEGADIDLVPVDRLGEGFHRDTCQSAH